MIQVKKLAREWLVFLGNLAIGGLVIPLVVLPRIIGGDFLPSKFYAALIEGREKLVAWLILLGPYILWQLVRSIVWAIKAARADN